MKKLLLMIALLLPFTVIAQQLRLDSLVVKKIKFPDGTSQISAGLPYGLTRLPTDTLDLGTSTVAGVIRWNDETSHQQKMIVDGGHTQTILFRYKSAFDSVAYLSDVGSGGGNSYWSRTGGQVLPTTTTDSLYIPYGKAYFGTNGTAAGEINISSGASYTKLKYIAATASTLILPLELSGATDTLSTLKDIRTMIGGGGYWEKYGGTLSAATTTDSLLMRGGITIGESGTAGFLKITSATGVGPDIKYSGASAGHVVLISQLNGVTDSLAYNSTFRSFFWTNFGGVWSRYGGTLSLTTATDSVQVNSGYIKSGSYGVFIPTPSASDTLIYKHLSGVLYNKTFAATSVWNGNVIDTTYLQSKVIKLIAGTGISVTNSGLGSVTVSATGSSGAGGWSALSAGRVYTTAPQDSVYIRSAASDSVGTTQALLKVFGGAFVMGDLEVGTSGANFSRLTSLASGVKQYYIANKTSGDTLAFKSDLSASGVQSLAMSNSAILANSTTGSITIRLNKSAIDSLASSITSGDITFSGALTMYGLTVTTGGANLRGGVTLGQQTATTGLANFYNASNAYYVQLKAPNSTALRLIIFPDMAGTIALVNPSSTQTFTTNNVWNGTAITDAYLANITTGGKVSGTAITSGNISTSGSLTITGTSSPYVTLGSPTYKGQVKLYDDYNGSILSLVTSGSVPSSGSVVFSKSGTVAMTSDISYPVSSVFGRTGAVTASSSDYSSYYAYLGGSNASGTWPISITGSAGSAPASDVYAWAKASTKPSYTKSEVGLGNVENTALSTWAGTTNLTTAGWLSAVSLSVFGDAASFVVASSGIITSGYWGGEPIGVSYGGTGSTTASGARSNLGLGGGVTGSYANPTAITVSNGIITAIY